MDRLARRLIDAWRGRQPQPGRPFGSTDFSGLTPQTWEEVEIHGAKFIKTPTGALMPAIAGGSRQYFGDILADPPIANLTAVTATSETALWLTAQYTPIPANDAKPGKIYVVCAGGIMSFAATGTLIITPRFGLTVAAGITMGPNVIAQTTPGTTTAHPWYMEFVAVVRTVGAPGTNSTVIGTGSFTTGTPGAANAAVSFAFGGTSATVDASIATGITIGWTLSVAGTVTPQYAFLQSLN